MTPGESAQPLPDEASTTDEPQALCIVRDMTTSSTATLKALLSVAASTSASKLMQLVGRHFSYSPDSFELLLQSHHQGEAVAIHVCEDQTIEELGFCVDGVSRNMLVIYDRNREPPKKLMGPELEEMSPSTATAEWAHGARNSGETTKYFHSETRETGYVGLVNQAMTCYLNSLLQTLYMTPEFRNALYRWEFDGSEQDAAKSIPFQLQKLFLLLQTSSRPAIGTTDLTTSFGWDSSEAWQQHDVQELCRVMFDALEHKFKKTNQANLICQLYEGKLKDYVQCLECGSESAREDTFLDVPLVVRPFGSSQAYGSVEEALRAFVTPETLEGSNQYSCDKCGKKCDAHKGLKFVRFPYLLTLQLKRFDFDPVTMHRIKLNDKVAFPEILDLNQFVRLDSSSENVCDDTDTTDSGSALDEEVPANSAAAAGTRTTNGPCEDTGSDDEGIDMGGMETAAANSRNCRRAIEKGPYVYELFSIMVHSGSANGGHYYAYVKSFTENQWFCFNDAQVSRVSYEEIRKTYGGGPSRSGYYISAYSSSTNAYMLMYRKVDKESNAEPMSPEEFPEHLKALLKSMQEAEERERQQKELERSMVKIKLFCLIPGRHTMQEMRLKVHKDSSLAEATQTAHQIMGLEGVVPLERCRLVMYDDCSESLECSLEDQEDQTIGEILGGVKSTYHCDLLLEIRGPHETFQPYKKGGTTVKVHVVVLESQEIARPVVVRGLKSQTVAEFKAQVAQQLALPSAEMRMVHQRFHTDLTLLSCPTRLLKHEDFGKSNTVYIEFLDREDAKKPFKESLFFEILDRHVNTIIIYVHLPPIDKVLMEKQCMPANGEQRVCNIEDEGGTSALSSAGGTSKGHVPGTSHEAAGSDYDSDLCDSSSSGCHGTGGDQSEDSSLTDSERTLVGDDLSPRNNSPDLAEADGAEASLGPTSEFVPSVELAQKMGENFRNCFGLQHEDSAVSPEEGPRSEDAAVLASGDAASTAATSGVPKEEPKRYFRAWPFKDTDNSRGLRVYVDKRITFGALKKELEVYVGIDCAYFKVFRAYSNGQEFECTKLMDNLTSYAEDTKLLIKLGRALQSGEYRMKVFLLTPNAQETSKFLLDWIFTKGVSVLKVKEDLLPEIRERCGLDIPLNRCRLRKKTSGNPGPVYLDSAKFDDEVPTFLSYEVFLEVLPGPERVVSSSSLVVFVRRWRPSSFTFDPLDEVVLEERTVDALKDALSSLSGLPPDNIEVAKCPGPFPCVVSSLTVHAEMEWHSSASSLSSWPLYISEDGLVVLYRDKTEPLKELTEEEKREISNRENVRAHKSLQTTTSVRKERALKIYTGSPPSNASGALSDAKPSLHSVPIDLD